MFHAHQENKELSPSRFVLVNGPVIVGAGPSGLAIGAGLKQQGVPFVILERSNCIASLWQNRTYDRLKLHLPRNFCQLPYFPFPENFPEYPTKSQFIEYLESYAKKFEINPMFNESVQSAKFDGKCGLWRVRSVGSSDGAIVEYISRWIVVATGENSEKVVPECEGIQDFKGGVIHACDYKSGAVYQGKKVLVVGCGNSGMEISLDLCHHNAYPSMVVRSSVHVLPREILGKSTFHLGVSMMKWMPQWLVDKMLLIASRFILGNLEKHGIKRPSVGPLKLKDTEGKTPVLDIGTLQKIKTGDIKVVPGISKFLPGGVELVDGQVLEIDSVVFATGYRSNVPSWLEENEFFSRKGLPRTPFPNGWKGEDGLYAAGFTRRGLSGASLDAIRVAQDIATIWKQETEQINQFLSITCQRRQKSKFHEMIKGTRYKL